MARTQLDRRKFVAGGAAFGVVGAALGMGAVLAQDEGTATPGASPEASPAASPGASPAAGGTEVTVECVDIDFNPNEFSIPAETDITVHIPNHGVLVHNFNIDDHNNPSDADIHSGDIQGGDSKTITVNLPAGDWYYYCNIPGHEAAGMHGMAHVG